MTPKNAVSAPARAAFVESELSSRCAGNRALMTRVLDAFEKSFAADLVGLLGAIETSDLRNAGSVAHKMRGASGNVAAHQLFDITSTIEAECKAASGDRATGLIADLQSAWDDFRDVLSQWKGS